MPRQVNLVKPVHMGQSVGFKEKIYMLKFVSKDGKLKYIWLDQDEKPTAIKDVSKETLQKLGVVFQEDSQTDKNRTSGLSQDDVTHLKGENK